MARKHAAQESAATVFRAVDGGFLGRFSTDAGTGCCFIEPLYFRFGVIYGRCKDRNRTEEANKVLHVNIDQRQPSLALLFRTSGAMTSSCVRAAMVLHLRCQRSRAVCGGAKGI